MVMGWRVRQGRHAGCSLTPVLPYLQPSPYDGQGCSGRCETFGLSGPLASSQEFVCQDLEVWSLEPDFG